MSRLGLDSQTTFGLPPLDHIALASRLGCSHVSLGTGQVPWAVADIPPWSLRDDMQLRSDTVQAARDSGVVLSLGEGFAIRENLDIRTCAGDLDIMAQLGVQAIGTVGLDPDSARALDQLAILADMTKDRGLTLLLEFAPPHAFPSLSAAVDAVLWLGASHAKLLIDAMHLFRCGNRPEELASLPPGLIARAQLSDSKLLDQGKPYMEEACFERLVPGSGELPLVELMAALPNDVPIGLEVPNRASSPDRQSLLAYIDHAVAQSRPYVDGGT